MEPELILCAVRRVDETCVLVKGRWCYLYRPIDSSGATIDFVLSGLRAAAAAKRLFRKALTFSDASCENSRICGRIRPAHNGTCAVGKSTVIAVETNRRDCYGRIQTETPLDIGARSNITRQKVGRCRNRFLEQGIGGIAKDAPRSGRLPSISRRKQTRIVKRTQA